MTPVPPRKPRQWTTKRRYLENGLHVGPDEARRIGDQVAQHASALLFVPADAAVLQLG